MDIKIPNVPIRTRWPGGGHRDEGKTLTLRIETADPQALAAYLTPERCADIASRMQERRELPRELAGGRWIDCQSTPIWVVQYK